MKKYRLMSLVLLALFNFFCSNDNPTEEEKYIIEINNLRAEKDSLMEFDPESPFNQDPKAEFRSLHYFDVDTQFVFKSKLTEYDTKDTITIFGTKGEERKAIRYGFLTFNYMNNEYKINVYKSFAKNGKEYYSIWFTDETTGDETYGVGRYLDFSLNADPDHIYTIDFNMAYNPYCAYSAKYSCAIPSKEDYIALEIKAGEKRFH